MHVGADISGAEAARRLHMRRSRMSELIRSGRIPTAYVTEGGRLRVNEYGLEQYVKERGDGR